MGPSGSVSTPPPCLELASRNPSWQAVSAPPSTGRTYDPKRSDPLAAPPLASRGPSTYGSRLARAYRHRAQNRRRGARLAGTREGRRGDAPRRALGGDPARCRDIPIHHVKQRSLLRSRGAFLRPGFALSLFHPPREGRAERCDVVTAGATPARAARSQHAANGSAARGEPITGGHAQWVTERPLEPSFSNSSSSVMSRFLYSSGIDSTS